MATPRTKRNRRPPTIIAGGYPAQLWLLPVFIGPNWLRFGVSAEVGVSGVPAFTDNNGGAVATNAYMLPNSQLIVVFDGPLSDTADVSLPAYDPAVRTQWGGFLAPGEWLGPWFAPQSGPPPPPPAAAATAGPPPAQPAATEDAAAPAAPPAPPAPRAAPAPAPRAAHAAPAHSEASTSPVASVSEPREPSEPEQAGSKSDGPATPAKSTASRFTRADRPAARKAARKG